MDSTRDIEPEKIIKLRQDFDLKTCDWVPTKGDYYEVFMGKYNMDGRGEVFGYRLVVFAGLRVACDLTFYPQEFRAIIEHYGEMNTPSWQRRHDREVVEERNKTGGFEKLGGD